MDELKPHMLAESSPDALLDSAGAEPETPIETDDPTCGTAQRAAVPLADVTIQLGQLTDQIQNLQKLFNEQIMANDLNRAAFDRLHREMTEYKENFLHRAQEPLYKGLIGIDDEIEKMLAQDAPTQGDLKFLQSEIEEILYRHGVDSFVCDGDSLDPTRQKVIQTVASSDPSLHRQVSARVRRGYTAQGRTLRPEYVNVYICDQPSGEINS